MDEAYKALAQAGTLGGIVAVALFLIGRIVMKVADRMIAASDRIAEKLEEHTTIDIAHHAQVQAAIAAHHAVIREQLIELNAKLEGAAQERALTPVEGIPVRRTPVEGVYGVKRRAATRGDDDK